MIRTLREFYGLQPTPPSDLFQFVVWEVLSERALPARRDLAWHALRRLPALTPDAMFRTPAKDLVEAVGLAGPHREEKVEQLRTLAGDFRRHRELLNSETIARGGLITVARALHRLSPLSRATRDRIMLFVAGRVVLPVDDDINRVVSRLMGKADNRHRGASRRWLARTLLADGDAYREAVIYLRHHAQHTCLKVAPHCGVCPLGTRCAFASVQRRHAPS